MMHLKIFLVVLIGSLTVNEIDGCQCMTAMHPQDQFCSANYVIKGKIIDRTTMEGPLEYSPERLVYTVRVEVVYKGAQHVSGRRTVQISTETLCGVQWMQENQKYVIMGTVASGELRLSMCSSYAVSYSRLSNRQRQGLKYHWEQECGICTPHTCRDRRPCSSRDTCYYEPFPNPEQDCELQFARCTQDGNAARTKM